MSAPSVLRRGLFLLTLTLAVPALRSPAAAGPLRPGKIVLVRAGQRVEWRSAAGRVGVWLHVDRTDPEYPRLGLRTSSGIAERFELPTWGGKLFLQALALDARTMIVRIYERADSLGSPRFTACARLEVTGDRVLLTNSAEGGDTEFECPPWAAALNRQ